MALFHSSTSNTENRFIGETKHIPFNVYIQVFPERANGRRFEYIRELQKLAQFVEDELVDSSFNIAIPVAFTPQVGQAPPRLSIQGFDASLTANVPPVDQTTQPTIIHSGTLQGEKTATRAKPPSGGDLSRGQDPTSATDDKVADLKSSLEVVLDAVLGSGNYVIFFIDYNGVKYGSLPPKKAFRSFPS